MDSVANPELITPNISFQSGIRLQAADGSTPPNAETIVVSVCSEFTTHSMPATTVDSRHKLGIALDSENQPIVFTIGNDGRFYCIQHVTGQSWKAVDITPYGSTASAVTFDVYYSSGKVAIGVAVNLTSSSSAPTLYFAGPISITSTFNPSAIAFTKINNDPSVPVVSMTVAASDSNLKKPFFMVIGTQETASDRAMDYVVSTDPSESSPWSIISLPENATTVLKVVPVTQRIPFNACVASLYQQVVAGESPPPDVGTAISCYSLEKSLNIAVVLDKIGGGRDVSTTVTAKGLSDLYVAGVNGIGYYSSQRMDRDPVVILPDVSFQQVVASEDNHKISIFALSKFGDLYYIEGTRKSSTGTPKFTAPTYPIRKGVGILSTQYNAAVNACEAMYVDSSSQLKHLWRDSKTETWSEQTIHVPTSSKAISYHAFVSHIQLQGSRGASIRGGREIILSATELAYVIVNDVAHRLDRDPVKLTTDSDGQVRVVIQAGSQLASPTISATLVGVTDPDFGFRVEPRQRVLRKWARVQSGSDLKNAKSTAGDPVFPNTTIHDETFATAANLLSRTPDIISHVDGSASTLTGSNASASFATSSPQSFFACERTTSGHSVISKLDWTDGAQDALDALGDFLESVWHGMLRVGKFAINVVGDVVNFFAEIRGKVLRWVLDTVGSVIRCVATFLKDTLGIDLTRFLALFGFLWDYPNILKTQRIIVKTVQDGSALLQDTVQGNTPWLKTYIKELRSLITPFIKDERVPEAKNFIADATNDLEKSFLGKLLKSVLDNPIIKAVLRYASMWMLQVISLLDDQISFPGLGDLENVLDEKFGAILEKLMIDAEDGLFSLVRDIFNGIGEVVAGTRNIGDLFTMIFSDAFWSIFDAAQDVALSLVDLLSDLLGGILKMVTGHIKFPGTSAFWESFTETPFSIVDVGSLILAQIMYLVTMMWQEKLPFDVMTPWYLLLPEKGSIHFPPIQDGDGGGRALTKLVKRQAPDVALQSDSGSVLTHMMIDMCCYELSSLASMFGSALELAILSPKTRMEGFELHNFDGEGVGYSFPEIEATRSALPFIRNLQIACSGVQLAMNTTILCNAFARIISHENAARDAILPLFKVVAIAMNGITLAVRIKGLEATYPWASYLAPGANIIDNLPGGIWSFVDSDKTSGDWIAFSGSLINTTAAGCDIATTAFSQMGEQRLKWIPFGISAGLNIAQAGTTVWYYCDYKANH